MVQGMAFLSKKGFNPQNQVNRKQVWEAQQHSKLEKDRIRQREEQLRREREDEELCAARHNGDGSQAQLRFMYDAPPGLKNEEQKKLRGNLDDSNSRDLTQAQPGDDAAAAAFRQMLAAASSSAKHADDTTTGSENKGDENGEIELKFAPVLQGSTLERDSGKPNDTRSALEKAVGRKDRGAAVTLEEQVARFPQLKNAPMAKGMSATDVNVSFKPLGAQVRNVKCLACGVWGHSRGDRECQMTGWDPFGARTAQSVPISSAIRPTKTEQQTNRDTKATHRDEKQLKQSADERSFSSSSSSDDDSRAKRKRKHSSKHKKKDKDSSHRKRSRKYRSSSSHRRSKSHEKRQSRRDES